MIGYYAHGQGSGHCNYAQLLSYFLREKLLVFTDSRFRFWTGTQVVRLPNENVDGTEFNRDTYSEPLSLHYAPVNLSKITSRNFLLLQSILKKGIKLLIVDVSVEIAMLARVSSVPYAYVRLMGERSDVAHINAYQGASFLLAYFPRKMENVDTPKWIIDKTIYLGFISKFLLSKKKTFRPEVFNADHKLNVVHLQGFGGSKRLKYDLDFSKYNVVSVGPGHASEKDPRVTHMGIVECTRAFIEYADIIIAACGSNTTSEILNLGKRFIAIEEKRHFNEHGKMAEALYMNKWALPLSHHASMSPALEALQMMDCSEPIPNGMKELKKFVVRLCANMDHMDKLLLYYRSFEPINGRKITDNIKITA